jgi:hypothetical protein
MERELTTVSSSFILYYGLFFPPRYILKVMDYSKRHSLTDSTCPRDGKPWEEES